MARAYGWTEDRIEVIDEDLGKSGSSVERRTGWQYMLQQIAANAVGAVFAVNISRLSRQLIDFETLRILASFHGVLLVMDNRISDPRNANDAVLAQVTATIAQFENKKRTEHMSQARMAKARQGAAVSSLPVGWIKNSDGKFDYDPTVKENIHLVINTFRENRSIRRTVKALLKTGVQIPSRQGRRLYFTKPTIGRVLSLLRNPAYAGTYVFGKTQCRPGGTVLASGQSPRAKVPEHLWIKIPNHHPAYMTQEEQEEIKSILAKNCFQGRGRPGRGHALSQGLLRCAVCKKALSVNYCRGESYQYGCGWDTEPCTRFISYEFDNYILREVFKVLKAPPLEILRSALEESRLRKGARISWISAERERLDWEIRKAQAFVESSRGSHPRVCTLALDKLEMLLKEKEDFEQKIALERTEGTSDEVAEDELEELCRLTTDVPALWNHPVVTHQERKEILHCIIDHIVVAAAKERIDATIVWKNGEKTSFFFWRGIGCYNLIRELHSQNLTVFEIKDHLAAGKTSTGQAVKITVGRIYMIMNKLGLKPNRFAADYLMLRQKADQLNRDGQSLEWIAEHFNEQGFTSSSGKPWTRSMVYGLIRAIGKKANLLEDLHRNAITEARARGLNYRQMAEEFNLRGIRRRDGRPWTARALRHRWTGLNRLERNRLAKRFVTVETIELSGGST